MPYLTGFDIKTHPKIKPLKIEIDAIDGMISVERSPSPPPSLATNKSYNSPDVSEQLETDFHGKCYLCERDVGSRFQIDHFKPKSGYPHLEHSWTNLFPACQCNQHRLKWSGRSEKDAEFRLKQFPLFAVAMAESDLKNWTSVSAPYTGLVRGMIRKRYSPIASVLGL